MAKDIGDTFDIHVDDSVELSHRHFPERGIGGNDGGAVYENVRRAKVRKDARGPTGDSGIGGNVERGKMMRRTEFLLQGLELVGRTSASHNPAIAGNKIANHRQAQTSRATCDDNEFHDVKSKFRLSNSEARARLCPVTETKSRFRVWAKRGCLLLVALLAVPPAQVAWAIFWNPTVTPMQWQRRVEAWRGNRPYTGHPVIWTPLKDIPQAQVRYIWASEDQAFFKHGGFDLRQLRKAIEAAQENKKSVRGASTITMQCARSVFLWQGRSYVRKVLEFYYTFWMELLLSKQRILELYLNSIEFGPGIYGIGAAAKEHYGKTPGELTRQEMVALAAILPNPLKWSPVKPDATVQKKMRRVERLAGRADFPAGELEKP